MLTNLSGRKPQGLSAIYGERVRLAPVHDSCDFLPDFGPVSEGLFRLCSQEPSDFVVTNAEDGFGVSPMRLSRPFPCSGPGGCHLCSPCHGQGKETDQQARLFGDRETGVFQVEAPGLRFGEQAFDGPAFAIDGQGVMGGLVADNDRQFLTFDAPGCEVQPKRCSAPGSPEVGRECARATAGAQQGSQTLPDAIPACHVPVRLHADDERNVLFMQESQPIKADKLTIRQKALDASGPEQIQTALHQCNALAGVAVARLAQHGPDQWHAIAARGDGKNQQVDLFAPDLPVRAIKAQMPTPGEPEHPDNKRGRPVFPEVDILKKALQSTVGAFNLGLRRHLPTDVTQVHRSHAGNANH